LVPLGLMPPSREALCGTAYALPLTLRFELYSNGLKFTWVRFWTSERVRAALECTHLSDDETVAKMGHPFGRRRWKAFPWRSGLSRRSFDFALRASLRMTPLRVEALSLRRQAARSKPVPPGAAKMRLAKATYVMLKPGCVAKALSMMRLPRCLAACWMAGVVRVPAA
jgi:hypothetical protein